MTDDPPNFALLPAGLMDLLPPEAEHEAALVEAMMAAFARHGYERVKPPLLEFEESLLAGARFLVSPAFVPDMITVAKGHDAMTMPGTMTPTEMVAAANAGADFIKVYPLATIGGPGFIMNVRRALQRLPLVATGNVEFDEIPAYLAAGVVGFGIGGPLVRPDLLDRGDRDGAIANAKRFLAATRSAAAPKP